MSVETICTRLAANYAEITGVKKAYAQIPRVLQNAELPAVVIFPSAAQTEREGADMSDETRTYVAFLAIAEALLGTETQGQINTAPYFDRVKTYFMGRGGLELNEGTNPQDVVFEARFLGDDGFQVIPYPLSGKLYAAIQFRHEVEEYANIEYQD